MFYTLSRSTSVYVAFLDASKAFDKISHWTLFRKLVDRCVPLHLVMGSLLSNRPKKMKFETVPLPDFDENLHIWSIWSEKKICQIIAYLVKYFPRYGPLSFAKIAKIGPPAP